ncbi:hypothetical protein QUF88_13815 [Bacillus sp. DX1.1]|uniref:hypothetical protein n=1 Tax=unclassified Bacillus (in: firmicutes) TaxID=185979 RepID=UPI0025700488|nr:MULTISPECIES: hypothetical protein [unclassified Bacillus (in: firmicutes)]MDM5154860.1 hypothetical protein [Bacillus sp. DX1.1]WJE83734.1 hypothetical protein QRE67_11310 [Bacillus sp. DX3.1]
MNKRLKILMKITPFLSVLFILIGLIMAILGALDHNLKLLTGSLFVIAQAVLAITYTKMFKKIGF